MTPKSELEQAATEWALKVHSERICPACGEVTVYPASNKTFKAGAAWADARTLELLRSEERVGALNDTGWMHADWLESKWKGEK